MKKSSNNIYDENQATIKGGIMGLFWCAILITIFNLLFPPLSFPKYIAWFNSRKTENILEGCLYYLGENKQNSARGGFYRFQIENFMESHDLNISSINSPIANDIKKRDAFFKQIYQENLPRKKCYKVKYITGRFSYLKRAYLYDIFE